MHRPPRYRFFAAVESKTQPYSKSIVKGVYYITFLNYKNVPPAFGECIWGEEDADDDVKFQ
mgnify:FL=1